MLRETIAVMSTSDAPSYGNVLLCRALRRVPQ